GCTTWNSGEEGCVLCQYALSGGLFQTRVFAQQTPAAQLAPGELGGLLLGDFAGQRVAGPDLAVWVRVAGAHHGPAVFEDLDIVDGRLRAEFRVLVYPDVHHCAQASRFHGGEGEVVARGETDHAANAGFGFGDE